MKTQFISAVRRFRKSLRMACQKQRQQFMKPLMLAAILVVSATGISCKCTADKENKQNARDCARPPVTFFSHQQLDVMLNASEKDRSAVEQDNSTRQSFGLGKILAKGQGGESYGLQRRTLPGYVEMHEQWDDVVIMRSGHGILRTGLKVNGNMKTYGEKAARNWSGGIIEDVSEQSISPGDMLIIPAMTAHQYVPAKNDPLTYWIIKIKRVNQP